MKLNKIRIYNINSLRGEFEIDFSKEPFASSTLFAITGPTGSGKSTILDAISLALFNRIPRINGSISKKVLSEGGFLLTRNEKECYVEVEYSCATGDFRSRWSTRRTRNHTQDDYQMELIDLSTNKPVDGRKSDIPSKNESLIGLNYDQFLRAILLAQGAFSAFLDANANDRAKLLEDISGTGIYRKLGARAYEEYHNRYNEIRDRLNTIETLRSEQMSEEDYQSFMQGMTKVEEQLSSLRKQETKLNSLISLKIRLQKSSLDLAGIEQSFQLLQQRQHKFDVSIKPRLDKHRELAELIDEIRSVIEERKELTGLDLTISALKTELLKKQDDLERSILEVSKFTNRDTVADNVSINLNEYREQVSRLQSELRAATERYQAAERPVLQYLKHANLKKYALQYPSDDLLEKVASLIHDLSKQAGEGVSRNAISPGILALNHKIQALLELKGLVGQFLELKNQVRSKKDQQQQLQENLIEEKVINELAWKVSEGDTRLQQMNEKLYQLISEASSGAKQLREKLKEGEPCPVCGSPDHPYAENYIDRLEEERRQISKFNEELEWHKRSLQEKKQVQLQTIKRLKEIEEELISNENQLQELNEKIITLKKVSELEEIGKPAVVDKALEQARFEQRKLEMQQEVFVSLEALTDLDRALREFSQLTILKNDARAALEKVYAGNNINQECDSLLDRFNSANTALQTFQNRLGDKEKDHKRISESIDSRLKLLLPQLVSKGYAGISEAFAEILSPTEFQSFIKEENDLQSERVSLESRKQQVKIQQQREMKEDDPLLTREQCEWELAHIKRTVGEQEKLRTEFVGKLSAQDDRSQLISKLQSEIGEKEKEVLPWRLLNILIGDRTGNKFNGFAQELTMSKLIKLTNVHLKHFNDRYVLSMPNKNEDEDLVIIDGYMGNERRSVKTLSGGEKFMVSLSLALSMSDLASREVTIQSLFIDEGISTLDPETLDQVVSTLEQLQSASQKTIGVISHVEALKDRILTQVQLEKMPTGFSMMKIVP